ncbi:ASCH domain-containing protein [Pseudomonas oryzihabitans]|uniref:hypothetical protein n=1 Tax=Pseudomonas oryzihabitans TaxID=47885 RepID=UPI0011AAC722|nr:hypothetical protein [Pseudomonas oryzihabitans]
MTERPILFNDDMVRAVLEGRKTVTRRAVVSRSRKRPHMVMVDNHPDFPGCLQPFQADEHGSISFEGKGQCEFPIACPFGQVGDRLWVREAWEDVHPVQVTGGRYTQLGRAGIPGPPGVTYQTIYRSDGPYPQVYHTHEHPYRSLSPVPGCFTAPAECGWVGWCPSIHMPRWASRLLLEVTAVRVERLHAITPEQIEAEGLSTAWPSYAGEQDLRGQWKDLWEETGGDWSSNPWVWVIEFQRVTAPSAAAPA